MERANAGETGDMAPTGVPVPIPPGNGDSSSPVRMGRLSPLDVRHGTLNGYSNLRCRCAACKGAWRDYQATCREIRHARLLLDPTLARHGWASTYGNWGCRCERCRRAWTRQAAERRQGTRPLRAHPDSDQTTVDAEIVDHPFGELTA